MSLVKFTRVTESPSVRLPAVAVKSTTDLSEGLLSYTTPWALAAITGALETSDHPT